MTDVDHRFASPETQPYAPVTGNLADLLERVLDKASSSPTTSRSDLLDIELLTIRLRLFIASVDAEEGGHRLVGETDPAPAFVRAAARPRHREQTVAGAAGRPGGPPRTQGTPGERSLPDRRPRPRLRVRRHPHSAGPRRVAAATGHERAVRCAMLRAGGLCLVVQDVPAALFDEEALAEQPTGPTTSNAAPVPITGASSRGRRGLVVPLPMATLLYAATGP